MNQTIRKKNKAEKCSRRYLYRRNNTYTPKLSRLTLEARHKEVLNKISKQREMSQVERDVESIMNTYYSSNIPISRIENRSAIGLLFSRKKGS